MILFLTISMQHQTQVKTFRKHRIKVNFGCNFLSKEILPLELQYPGGFFLKSEKSYLRECFLDTVSVKKNAMQCPLTEMCTIESYFQFEIGLVLK